MVPLPLGVCILAGGRGRRLGMDKAMVELGGKTLLSLALEKAHPLGVPVVVSSGRRTIPGVECVRDRKGEGPMAGIYAALELFYRILVFPVDMPFLPWEFLHFLMGEGSKVDILVCRVRGVVQPQVGVYSRVARPFLEERLDRGDWALRRVLQESLDVRVLEEEDLEGWGDLERLFFNINTPVDLERAREWGG